VRRPDLTLATMDHNVPTDPRQVSGELPMADELSVAQMDAMRRNAQEFGIKLFEMGSRNQGIVHIIGPELGLTQPGAIIVCGDSHTATHGAFGALAFGIGTSEVEHVLATQTLPQARPKDPGDRGRGRAAGRDVTAKDLILHILGVIGVDGGVGQVIEYRGQAIRDLSMEGRMTVCNMSIEGGCARRAHRPGRDHLRLPEGPSLRAAGRRLGRRARGVAGAAHRRGRDLRPHRHHRRVPGRADRDLGHHPGAVGPGHRVGPAGRGRPGRGHRAQYQRALDYMGLEGGERITDIAVDKVFIGSCTNGRIEDLRAVAEIVKGQHKADGVEVMVVPGSGLVKEAAEAEGLADVLRDAGFDWREPGCSMCLGMNPDQLAPGERCASTSNRNFEGRQGFKGRTHLVSPAMAAAAALTGRLTDVRGVGPMTPVSVVKGRACPIDANDVDTDQIIPKQYLKRVERTGFGPFAFAEWRYEPDGTPKADFAMNRPEHQGAPIMVSGRNFGCGSSREHAPWALEDAGFTAIIAPSFADIFRNNCGKVGIVAVELDEAGRPPAVRPDRRRPGRRGDRRPRTAARHRGCGRRPGRHRRAFELAPAHPPLPAQRARRRRPDDAARGRHRHLRGGPRAVASARAGGVTDADEARPGRPLGAGGRARGRAHGCRRVDRVRHPGLPRTAGPVDPRPGRGPHGDDRQLRRRRRGAARGVAVALRHARVPADPEPGPPRPRRPRAAGHLDLVITQNVDGLHQRAGSSPDRVVEVHGTSAEVGCLACEHRWPADVVLDRVEAGDPDPTCDRCGGMLKAATVSFGQPLDPDDVERADRAAREADVLIAAGTTLGVYPVAAVPAIAAEHGASIVIVNDGATEQDDLADVVLRGQDRRAAAGTRRGRPLGLSAHTPPC
jgi:homoaconitase/3-isopropylmalate dehydratase large subunit